MASWDRPQPLMLGSSIPAIACLVFFHVPFGFQKRVPHGCGLLRFGLLFVLGVEDGPGEDQAAEQGLAPVIVYPALDCGALFGNNRDFRCGLVLSHETRCFVRAR